MKLLKLTIFFISLTISSLNAQEKLTLVTVYSKDCPHSQELITNTYTNISVSNAMQSYNHIMLEAENEFTKKFMKTFGVTAYPTQIMSKIIGNEVKHIKLEGSLSVVEQLNFLTQASTSLTTENDDENDKPEFIDEKMVKFVCRGISIAKSSAEDSYKMMIDTIGKIVKRDKLNVKNIPKYAFDNIDKLICENTDTIKLREHNTVLKHALDTANYDFLRNAIFVKKDGKNICNPYIDFTRVENIDGEDESLLDFFDKVIDHVDSRATHDLPTVKDIREDVKACIRYRDA